MKKFIYGYITGMVTYIYRYEILSFFLDILVKIKYYI